MEWGKIRIVSLALGIGILLGTPGFLEAQTQVSPPPGQHPKTSVQQRPRTQPKLQPTRLQGQQPKTRMQVPSRRLTQPKVQQTQSPQAKASPQTRAKTQPSLLSAKDQQLKSQPQVSPTKGTTPQAQQAKQLSQPGTRFADKAPVYGIPPGPDPCCHTKTAEQLGIPLNKPMGGQDILNHVTNPKNNYKPTIDLTANHPDGSVVLFRNATGFITHSSTKVNGVWVQLNRPAPSVGIKSQVTTAGSIAELQKTFLTTHDETGKETGKVPAGWNRDKPEVYVPK